MTDELSLLLSFDLNANDKFISDQDENEFIRISQIVSEPNLMKGKILFNTLETIQAGINSEIERVNGIKKEYNKVKEEVEGYKQE